MISISRLAFFLHLIGVEESPVAMATYFQPATDINVACVVGMDNNGETRTKS